MLSVSDMTTYFCNLLKKKNSIKHTRTPCIHNAHSLLLGKPNQHAVLGVDGISGQEMNITLDSFLSDNSFPCMVKSTPRRNDE